MDALAFLMVVIEIRAILAARLVPVTSCRRTSTVRVLLVGE
jgi:hypothetical protein